MPSQRRSVNDAKDLAGNFMCNKYGVTQYKIHNSFENSGDWVIRVMLYKDGKMWLAQNVRVPVDATDNNIRIV